MNDSLAAGRPHLRATTSWICLHRILWCSLVLLALFGLGGCNEPEATPASAPTAVAALPPATPPAVAASPPTLTPTPVASEATGTATATTTATGCLAPAGWASYTVVQGDILSGLGASSGATVAELIQANCLVDDKIYEGQTLHLPSAPPPTATPTPEPTRCGAPAGWIVYIVQPGDTLSGLAGAVGASVEVIRLANCLPNDTIYAGRGLRLPALPNNPGTGAASVAPTADIVERPTHTPPTPCPSFACSPSQQVDLLGETIDFGTGAPADNLLCLDGEQISIGVQIPNGAIFALPTPIIVGAELIFGACNADVTAAAAFSLTVQDGAPMPLPTTTVNVAGTPIPAAIWVAGCAQAGRQYTISYVTGAAAAVTREFGMTLPDPASGYVVPLGNGTYRVHFCYGNPPDKPISLMLFHGTLDLNVTCVPTIYRAGETLTMTTATSGFHDLILPLPADSGNCYVLQDRVTGGKPFVQIALPTTGGNE